MMKYCTSRLLKIVDNASRTKVMSSRAYMTDKQMMGFVRLV